MNDQKQQSALAAVAAACSKMKPYMAMISLQFGFAVMTIVNLVCLKRGMSNYVLVVYRNAVSTLAVAPFAFIFERKIIPKMTLSIFIKIMALAFIGIVVDQNLTAMGMKYISATYTTAMYNIAPAVTFIMAIVFRLEKVKISNIRSQAKIIGTLVSLGAAAIMTFYKGPVIKMVSCKSAVHVATTTTSTTGQNWIAGTLMILASVIAWCSFVILQSMILKECRAELFLSTLIVFSGVVEAAAVALVMEHDLSVWAIGFDSSLLAPVFSGIVGSAFAYYVQGTVLKVKGPVFVSAFSPLCMIITAILGSLMLSEQMHLGSIMGAIIIVVGLFSFIWGKSKDHVVSPEVMNGKISSIASAATTNADEGNFEMTVIAGTDSQIMKYEVRGNASG